MTDHDPTSEAEAEDTGSAPETERVVALQAEIDRLKDQLLRALAEQENARRRTQRDKEESVKYATSNFAKDLLTTADNLRRALDAVKPDQVLDEATKTLIDGVAATERELLSVFERHNIRRIDPLDEKFDHNFHQAIFEVEHTQKPAGTVVQVLAPGYVLHDRLLRAAMVGVAKGQPSATPPKPPESGERPHRIDTTA
jgi:molecular chaperone GrpE